MIIPYDLISLTSVISSGKYQWSCLWRRCCSCMVQLATRHHYINIIAIFKWRL